MELLLAVLLVGISSFAHAEDFTKLGYYRVVAVSPVVKIGNPAANGGIAIKEAKEADARGASVVLFPELSLTGYTAEDMFINEGLLNSTKLALAKLRARSAGIHSTIVVGAPYRAPDGRLYNVAFVISRGKILGAVPKTHIPNYGEFNERRWFVPGGKVEMDINDSQLGKFHLGTRQLFRVGEMVFGVEIGEDVRAPLPPSTSLALAGANVILNLSASNELVGKADYRRNLIAQQSERLLAAYVYVSAGPTESGKDLVFGGHSLIYENGSKLAEGELFKLGGTAISADIDVQKLLHERQRNMTFGNQDPIETNYLFHEIENSHTLKTLEREYAKTPFVPSNVPELNARAEEIISIQAMGLARRLMAAKSRTISVDVSGELGSALALLVAREAARILKWQPSQIIGTTEVTTASDNHIVVGTVDLSDLCLGGCTNNAGRMPDYSVNVSIPKTLVKYLVDWFADHRADENLKATLKTIVATEISTEQRLNDFFIYHYLGNGFSVEKVFALAKKTFHNEFQPAAIQKLLHDFVERFYDQQFKRTTLPAGPKVGSVSVSPRGDMRVPDEASCGALLAVVDGLDLD